MILVESKYISIWSSYFGELKQKICLSFLPLINELRSSFMGLLFIADPKSIWILETNLPSLFSFPYQSEINPTPNQFLQSQVWNLWNLATWSSLCHLKVWVNRKCSMTLTGHSFAVWAVAILPEVMKGQKKKVNSIIQLLKQKNIL